MSDDIILDRVEIFFEFCFFFLVVVGLRDLCFFFFFLVLGFGEVKLVCGVVWLEGVCDGEFGDDVVLVDFFCFLERCFLIFLRLFLLFLLRIFDMFGVSK